MLVSEADSALEEELGKQGAPLHPPLASRVGSGRHCLDA